MPVLTPEQQARTEIDRMLDAAGWQVQTRQTMNRHAAPGVAVCEFPTTTAPVGGGGLEHREGVLSRSGRGPGKKVAKVSR